MKASNAAPGKRVRSMVLVVDLDARRTTFVDHVAEGGVRLHLADGARIAAVQDHDAGIVWCIGREGRGEDR
jgi:hypothetical protein